MFLLRRGTFFLWIGIYCPSRITNIPSGFYFNDATESLCSGFNKLDPIGKDRIHFIQLLWLTMIVITHAPSTKSSDKEQSVKNPIELIDEDKRIVLWTR